MKDKNKTEQILLRLNTSLKEDIRKRAEQTNLSMSSYIIKKLEGDSLNTQLFSEIQRENRELKDQLQETFFYLKRDTEELKELITNKEEAKQDTKFDYKEDKDSDLTDINSYTTGDILQVAEEFVLVKNVLKNENKIAILFIKNLETKVLKLSEHNHLIKSIKKLRG
jgi:hypothetical protein